MKTRPILVFALGLVLWLAYFYGANYMIMAAQSLPVGWDLMPADGS